MGNTLPPGADAGERGADDRPLLMGCAVPRMQRPGPPNARRMPLFMVGTVAWETAYGRFPLPLIFALSLQFTIDFVITM